MKGIYWMKYRKIREWIGYLINESINKNLNY